MKTEHEIAYRLDPALWAKDVLGISPRIWQEQFLRVPRGQDVLVLTARQIGKTTAAAIAIAHTAIFKPGSVSVVACPAQRQSAELLRKVREMVLKGGAKRQCLWDRACQWFTRAGAAGQRRVNPRAHGRWLDRR